MARESDIDYAELTRNVNRTRARLGAVTLGEVLLACPATQGVASVIGLMVLAERHAAKLSSRVILTWESPKGEARRGVAPDYLFDKNVPDRVSAGRRQS